MKKNFEEGTSLFEVVVVVGIFAIIGVLVTSIVFLSVAGTKRSDSLISVRQNLNYAASIMERQLRSAQSVTPCGIGSSSVTYLDQDWVSSSFVCNPGGWVASGSARLTSSDVQITACSFTCDTAANTPTVVRIDLAGKDPNIPAWTNPSLVTISTRVSLRNP